LLLLLLLVPSISFVLALMFHCQQHLIHLRTVIVYKLTVIRACSANCSPFIIWFFWLRREGFTLTSYAIIITIKLMWI
jgi:hypothetical protein